MWLIPYFYYSWCVQIAIQFAIHTGSSGMAFTSLCTVCTLKNECMVLLNQFWLSSCKTNLESAGYTSTAMRGCSNLVVCEAADLSPGWVMKGTRCNTITKSFIQVHSLWWALQKRSAERKITTTTAFSLCTMPRKNMEEYMLYTFFSSNLN